MPIQSQHSTHSKAVLDDSFITVDTPSLDHTLYYCTVALGLCKIYDDLNLEVHSYMPMNDTKRK